MSMTWQFMLSFLKSRAGRFARSGRAPAGDVAGPRAPAGVRERARGVPALALALAAVTHDVLDALDPADHGRRPGQVDLPVPVPEVAARLPDAGGAGERGR